jgi:cobaltochelatase CobN
MAHASGSWSEEGEVADTYLRRMGHGYGGGRWGVPMETELRAALAGTEAIVHSRSSRLYGTLNNDDFFSYGASIALGVRRVRGGGASPPLYVSDLRTPGKERHERIERVIGAELRTRYTHPEFVAAMRDEGYAGAREVWKGSSTSSASRSSTRRPSAPRSGRRSTRCGSRTARA